MGREENFEDFFAVAEPRLRRALVAAFGGERGREATIVALGKAWTIWERVCTVDNKFGYIYRIGHNFALRQISSEPQLRESDDSEIPSFESASMYEPGLVSALNELSLRQRQTVVLIKGYGMTYEEVAALLDVAKATIQTHADRGIARLRLALGVHNDY